MADSNQLNKWQASTPPSITISVFFLFAIQGRKYWWYFFHMAILGDFCPQFSKLNIYIHSLGTVLPFASNYICLPNILNIKYSPLGGSNSNCCWCHLVFFRENSNHGQPEFIDKFNLSFSWLVSQLRQKKAVIRAVQQQLLAEPLVQSTNNKKGNVTAACKRLRWIRMVWSRIFLF